MTPFVNDGVKHQTINQSFELLYIYFLFTVMFNQYQCDSTTHLVTEATSYQILWFGELLPNICTISFSVEDNYELCYNSVYFSMPRSLGDVKLKVENSTFVKVSKLEHAIRNRK